MFETSETKGFWDLLAGEHHLQLYSDTLQIETFPLWREAPEGPGSEQFTSPRKPLKLKKNATPPQHTHRHT